MHKILFALIIATTAVAPASGASLSRTFSYFSIGGNTLEEIEKQLDARGPHVRSTGRRHPGATQMEFTTRIGYGEGKGRCRIVSADVRVKAKVILPRWRNRKSAEQDVRLIWDTLERDIKRHEESHLSIAKNYARKMERTLQKLRSMPTCAAMAQKAQETTRRVLAEHDAAQDRFDRIESKNFESRILRLLNYRLQQIQAGRLPG
ncbi:putative secreted Zn-dependent protease [Mesorhizobium sp. J18]|uniref:DUF922 domain-containing Zn-dependent protease n=1 Tax=Mesorhizobium sp. J18 TaxID=935263 RepID=UPI00119BAEEA|nr:DUF922 domain-containing protein [Mesorhizobium sp. J18]TWG93820.1 putative secreted Zn-dependent protease [Mesorhizobium sp. J18]